MTYGIGIVGCGSIGRALIRAGQAGQLGAPLAGVTSRTAETAREFLASLESPPPYLGMDELVERSSLLIETAGGHVVPLLAEAAFGAARDLMVISIGALLEHPEIIERSRETGCRLYAPSGAIAGLDGIKSACQGQVERVEMVSRKPIAALEGAPYLVDNEIPVGRFTDAQEVFCGTAREACIGFPSNLNVSAAVSLAGIGPDRTTVRIVADPALSRNCHDITVEGEFGLLRVYIENIPSENPKTGRLTALSIIRSVSDVFDPVRIGT